MWWKIGKLSSETKFPQVCKTYYIFSKWKHIFIIIIYISSLPFNTQGPLWVCLLFFDSKTLYRVWAITESCIKSSYVVNENFNEHVLGKWKTDGLSVYISFISFVNPELTSHVFSSLFVSVRLHGFRKNFFHFTCVFSPILILWMSSPLKSSFIAFPSYYCNLFLNWVISHLFSRLF